MHIWDTYRYEFVPANTACSAMRMAGMYVDVERAAAHVADFDAKLAKLEKYIEGEAAKAGVALKFSDKHAAPQKKLAAFLFTAPRGLNLKVIEWSEKTGEPSTGSASLTWYASVDHPRKEDNKVVYAILKQRSLAGARAKYLIGFPAARRADGCIHPHSNWATVRTARLSMSDPPVHQIPEHSDDEVATAVKSIFVPRVKPARTAAEWDPRRHGSFYRWDVAGAEAAIRAAVLTKRFCTSPLTLYDYIRSGKDMHAKTASIIFDVPEGTYKKGDSQRDVVGKQITFALLYGGSWKTVQTTIWDRARVWIDDDTAKRYFAAFFAGYPELPELYERDKRQLGETTVAMAASGRPGYCEDGFGRRRGVVLPDGVTYEGVDDDGVTQWTVPDDAKARRALEHCFHVVANTPTQSMCAATVLWALALLYHGEYVPLAVPAMWTAPLFPEARNWKIDGQSLHAWQTNTVHDSGWGDCGPGKDGRELERVAKVIWRRCQAVPWDWLLDTDVPLRIELKVGADASDMRPYNTVAEQFGLEPMPLR